MLIKFDTVKAYIVKTEPPETTELYLNPAYVVSLAQDEKAKEKGHNICYLTMASRGDPEEGNDYYKVMGLAADLKNFINLHCVAIGP